MRSRSRRARASIAACAALAQLFVVTHGAFVDHTLSASGQIVETQASVVEASHSHESPSWCSVEAHVEVAFDACTVARSVHAARLMAKPKPPIVVVVAASRSNQHWRLALEPISVLMRSPKASPPLLG